MNRTNSIDQMNPNIMKLCSEGLLNSGANSLVIHQEEEDQPYVESGDQLSEVREDMAKEDEDLINQPEFFHQLSLRFYGENASALGEPEEQCRSEPDLYSEGYEGEYMDEDGKNDENQSKGNYQAKSLTDTDSTALKAKKSKSIVGYYRQGVQGNGESPLQDKIKGYKDFNKRLLNKSEDPARMNMLLNNLKNGNSDYKLKKGLKENPLMGEPTDPKLQGFDFGKGVARRMKAVPKNLP